MCFHPDWEKSEEQIRKEGEEWIAKMVRLWTEAGDPPTERVMKDLRWEVKLGIDHALKQQAKKKAEHDAWYAAQRAKETAAKEAREQRDRDDAAAKALVKDQAPARRELVLA